MWSGTKLRGIYDGLKSFISAVTGSLVPSRSEKGDQISSYIIRSTYV